MDAIPEKPAFVSIETKPKTQPHKQTGKSAERGDVLEIVCSFIDKSQTETEPSSYYVSFLKSQVFNSAHIKSNLSFFQMALLNISHENYNVFIFTYKSDKQQHLNASLNGAYKDNPSM